MTLLLFYQVMTPIIRKSRVSIKIQAVTLFNVSNLQLKILDYISLVYYIV